MVRQGQIEAPNANQQSNEMLVALGSLAVGKSKASGRLMVHGKAEFQSKASHDARAKYMCSYSLS